MPLFTLTSRGVITEPNLIMEKVFRNFMNSSRKQSTIYKDKVASYKYLYYKYGDNMDLLAENVESMLTELLEEHFTNVSIEAHPILLTDSLFKIEVVGEMQDIKTGITVKLKNDILNDN